MKTPKLSGAAQAAIINYGVMGLLVGGAFYALKNGAAKTITKQVTGAAIGVVDDAASGVVIGIGEAVGIPETNTANCQIAKNSGDTLAASFHCTAGEFIEWIADGKPQHGASGGW